MTRLLVCLVVGLIGTSLAVADEKPLSGPQPGEKLPALKVVGAYDDIEGKELDFVEQAGGKPTLLIFVHKVTRPGAAVSRALTNYAASREKDGMKVYVVWLHEDKTKAADFLKIARKSLGLKGLVGISPDGIEGPGKYGLNKNVELTILVAKEGKVTASFALVQPSVNDTPSVGEAIVKQVGGKAPTLKELEQLAYPGQGRPPR